jgi:predicted nucleic acid-binding protein
MIIDASIAVPWLVETPFSETAKRLRSEECLAPDLLLMETTNALLKYHHIGQISLDGILAGVQALKIAISKFAPDDQLLPSATRIAADNTRKIYDCIYLALALERNQPLATADKRLAAIARSLNIETLLIEPIS